MPAVEPNETEAHYVHRCIPVLVEEGKPQDQAIAICYSLYKQHSKKEATNFRQWLKLSEDGDLNAACFSTDSDPSQRPQTMEPKLPVSKEADRLFRFKKKPVYPQLQAPDPDKPQRPAQNLGQAY